MKGEFLTFFDGTIEIGGVAHAFGERTAGFRRHYAARAAGQVITRMVHIPFTRDVHINELATIGDDVYIIENVQPVRDSMPPCTVLTLIDYEVS